MISPVTQQDDLSTLGRKVYREQIEPKLSPDDRGRFVVIDVDSGDYEIADHDIGVSPSSPVIGENRLLWRFLAAGF